MCVCEWKPHDPWAQCGSTLGSLSSPGTEGEHAVRRVLCCNPMVPHTRNVIHSNVHGPRNIPKYISLNDTVIGSLFIK